jgi:hypothetical protein
LLLAGAVVLLVQQILRVVVVEVLEVYCKRQALLLRLVLR